MKTATNSWAGGIGGAVEEPFPLGWRVHHILQRVTTSIRKDNERVHDDEEKIVMPAVAISAPEFRVPNENLFLDGTALNSESVPQQEVGS